MIIPYGKGPQLERGRIRMTELYSEKDIQLISQQLKKRYTVIGVVLALLLALIIVSLVIRIQWLTMTAVFLFGAFAVFSIDLFCLPLHRYRKLLVSAVSGRTHVGTFEYKQAEGEVSMVDGVSCRSLIFLGEPDKHGSREQCFYWDAERPLPGFQPGQQVTLKYTGRNIIGYDCSAA